MGPQSSEMPFYSHPFHCHCLHRLLSATPPNCSIVSQTTASNDPPNCCQGKSCWNTYSLLSHVYREAFQGSLSVGWRTHFLTNRSEPVFPDPSHSLSLTKMYLCITSHVQLFPALLTSSFLCLLLASVQFFSHLGWTSFFSLWGVLHLFIPSSGVVSARFPNPLSSFYDLSLYLLVQICVHSIHSHMFTNQLKFSTYFPCVYEYT